MPQIIILYLKKTGELTKSLLFFAGMMLLPKLSTRQSLRAACFGILIAVIFCINFGMSDSHADVERTGDPAITVSAGRHSPGKKAIDHFNLGVNHQKQGDTLKAIEEYENVLKSDPNNTEAHNNLGVIYKELGNLDKAVEHYRFVVTTNPGMDEAHNNLGVVYYLRGNQHEAALEYLKALELNPNNLMSRINLGLIYKAHGLKLEAIDTIEQVLSEQPFHTEAHYNLAIIYEELEHLERAIWHYQRFVDNAGKGYPDLTERVTRHIKDLKVTSGEVLSE